MREDQRDGLRVLVVDELGELLRIGFLQRVEIGQFRAQRLHQPVHQFSRVLRPERAHEHLFRVVDAALEHVIVGHRHLVELFENSFSLVVADGGDARHFVADGLHFFFVHLPQDIGGDLVSQDDHQNGGFADAGNIGRTTGGFQVLNHRFTAGRLSVSFSMWPIIFMWPSISMGLVNV